VPGEDGVQLADAIAGHVQDTKPRFYLGEALDQLWTRHLRHERVGQQQVEIVRGRHRQGLLAAVRLEHRIAVLGQDPRYELQDGGLVIDDQDRLQVEPAGIVRCCWRGGRRGGGGEVQAEDGAATGLGLHVYAAAGLGHDAVHDGQSYPEAVADGSGGEERLEDARRDVGPHAGPGVRDGQLHVVSGGGLGVRAAVGLV
jgi:hypothetical protein